MVFSVAAATARRRIAVMATRQATAQGQKRSMAGPPPEWEGIDKVVRGVFPGDHQRTSFVVIAKLPVFTTTFARTNAVM
jgi:hypothetical protein